MYYTFLNENFMHYVNHAAHDIKHRVHNGKKIYNVYVARKNSEDSYEKINRVLTELIMCDSLEQCEEICHKELRKTNNVDLSLKYLYQILTIIQSSTQENFKENLIEYRNSLFN